MRIKKDFVKTEAIGDSFVVVPVGEESAKTHRVITLNETASFIYDGIAEGLDENAIAVKLTSEYNVPMDKALRDVHATAEKLIAAGVAE